jgi:uncharacterized protein YeeX (DUF496 family)
MNKTIETLRTSMQDAVQQLQDVLQTLNAVHREIDVQKDIALNSKPIGATEKQMRQLGNMQVNCFMSATDIQQQIDNLTNSINK